MIPEHLISKHAVASIAIRMACSDYGHCDAGHHDAACEVGEIRRLVIDGETAIQVEAAHGMAIREEARRAEQRKTFEELAAESREAYAAFSGRMRGEG